MSESVVARLEAVAARLEAAAARIGGGGGGDDSKEDSPAVIEYDEFFNAHVKPFLAVCAKLPEAQALGKKAEIAFTECRKVIQATSVCKKPPQKDLLAFIQPIVDVVSSSQDVDNRSKNFAHEKAFAEFIQLFNWLLMPGPAGVVSATLDQADFYLIKVLTQAKSKEDPEKQNHRDFVNGIKSTIKALADYVKQNFKMGLSWNPKGKDLSQFSAGGAVPGAPAAPAAPPAPPAPAPAPAVQSSSGGGGGGLGAVFAELNKKGATGPATSAFGLKKVTKDMKTKNLKDKPVVQPKAAAPKPRAKPVEKKAKAPPTTTLRKGTWFVENYDNEVVKLEEVQMKQSVYIYNCNNTTVQVVPKVKSIQIDKLNKCRVFFTNVVSTFEIINSNRVQVFVDEACGSITVDKSTAANIHLTEKSIKNPPNIVCSVFSELNVTIPGADAEADPIELAAPEQFTVSVKNGELVTAPVQHHG